MLVTTGSQGRRFGPGQRPRLALLCDYGSNVAATILDHINGLIRHSEFEIVPVATRGDLPASLRLEAFDGIVIHYTVIACLDAYLSPSARLRIRAFRGAKAVFVQDDYRFIDHTVDALRAMRIDVLLGLAPPGIIDDVYSPTRLPGVRRETVLAGYVPEDLLHRDVPAFSERHLDVGYRARKLPAWLGSFSQQKWHIADRFLADAEEYGLRVDISWHEEDRIYGQDWIDFVSGCKAMLGTESGSSVCDFTGEIQAAVEAHVAREPNVTFKVLRDLYFKEEDGRIMMNVISPRCFEAAALRTLMILYPGHYSGRMQPWRHYVPLEMDHSNIEDVIAVLRDPERAQAIIQRAYEEVACNEDNWFQSMARQFDDAMAQKLGSREPASDAVASTSHLPMARRYVFSAVRAALKSAKRLGFRGIQWTLRALPAGQESTRRQLRTAYLAIVAALRQAIYSCRASVMILLEITPLVSIGLLRAGTGVVADAGTLLRYRRSMRAVDGVQIVAEVVPGTGTVAIVATENPRGASAQLADLAAALREPGGPQVCWRPSDLGGIARRLPYLGERRFVHLGSYARRHPDAVAEFLEHVVRSKRRATT